MKDAIYDLMYEIKETYWWYEARRKIVLDRVRRSVPAASSLAKPRIIEFGCGAEKTSSLTACGDIRKEN